MEFRNVEVIKTERNFHYVEWSVKQTYPTIIELIDDYKFYIHHSIDPVSGFERIKENGLDVVIDGLNQTYYLHEKNQYNFDVEQYYKIEMVNKSDDSDVKFSNIIYIGSLSAGYHQVIRYEEETLYNFYSGEPSYIIKKKDSGSRCPECWSATRQQRIKSYCDTCHGSGYIEGYFSPIQVQIAFDSMTKQIEVGETREDVLDVLPARMSNYPLIRPKDFVINIDTAKRYVIQSVQTTKLPNYAIDRIVFSRQNYVLSQILMLVELNPSDQEYNQIIQVG